jgi:hypothetical protein
MAGMERWLNGTFALAEAKSLVFQIQRLLQLLVLQKLLQ